MVSASVLSANLVGSILILLQFSFFEIGETCFYYSKQFHASQSLQKSPPKSHEDIAAEIHAKAAALLSKVACYLNMRLHLEHTTFDLADSIYFFNRLNQMTTRFHAVQLAKVLPAIMARTTPPAAAANRRVYSGPHSSFAHSLFDVDSHYRSRKFCSYA